MNAQRFGLSAILGIAMLGLATSSMSAGGGGKNPPVYPPTAKPYGASLAEWQARDWQVYVGNPYDPGACTYGGFGRFGSIHDVLHMSVSVGTPVQFTCTIPTGVSLLIPVFTQWYACPTDCGPGKAAPNGTEEELAAAVNAVVDQTSQLEVEIDGHSIPNLFDYRTTSPAFWGQAVPGNGFDPPYLGLYGPAVAGGYYLMVPPLSAGDHVILVYAALGTPPFVEFETSFFLTVTGGRVGP